MNAEMDIVGTVLNAEELHALAAATTPDAAAVRQELQETLAQQRGDNNTAELTLKETQEELHSLAKVCWSGNYSTFKRFESLILFDLLRYQHELIKLENEIIEKHGNVALEQQAQLRTLVREYQEAIQRWRNTQKLESKPKTESAFWFLKLAETLREPNYIDHEEALEGLDVSIKDTGHDSIATWLQGFLLARLAIPETQRDRQAETRRKISSLNLSGQYNDHLAALLKRPRAVTLTPIVNRLATFTIALIGGVSLVAPMVVLVYLRSMTMKTVAISVSVLIFAAILAVFTQAKNQELLAATAAYAAVLVVFVGSPSSPTS